jgi:hypothetical protein
MEISLEFLNLNDSPTHAQTQTSDRSEVIVLGTAYGSTPLTATAMRSLFCIVLFFFLNSQATSVWSWWNCYSNLVPPSKRILKLNMDETVVRLYTPPRPGMLAAQKPREPFAPQLHVHPASRKQQRSTLMHVVFICDDTSIQSNLPHIIVGNEHVLAVGVAAMVRPSRNVYVLRRKSAWVNVPLMIVIIKLLGRIPAQLPPAAATGPAPRATRLALPPRPPEQPPSS